jgi:murein DD-endopeptidase MepM/ murein hydrolase activator NlpD
MRDLEKWIRSHVKKGFTIMLVPNSTGAVRSIRIPFSLILVILGIVIFNIYVFIGFTTQVWQLKNIHRQIAQKNRRISLLKREQKEVRPTLEKTRQTLEELNRLKKERERLLATWRAIQQKGGRIKTQVSRGSFIRTKPYEISKESFSEQSTLTQLQVSADQLASYIQEESEAQQKILNELLVYERRLDHTPSLWPVRTTITSTFGTRFHPLLNYSRKHMGIDLRARYGTKVMAAADGVVVSSGYQGGYGKIVVIDHGYGYQTRYAHNSRLLVQRGQKVKKGQVISLSGSSGTSTGPHLHYEVRINGDPVNPVSFLKND